MSEQSSSNPAHIQKQVKTYLAVFVGLIVLTLVAVGVSRLDLAVSARITIVVVFALLQAFLSVGYLMHLNAEKKLVYAVLLLTVVLFVALLLLPILSEADSTAGFVHVP